MVLLKKSVLQQFLGIPLFLSKSVDGKYVVAINEITNNDGVGTVESFFIEKDSLVFLSRSTTGGAHPCFVSVNEEGFVLTANYSGGNVGLLQMDKNGILSELLDVQQHQGQGTTDRQKGPHAHSACFEPGGYGIIAADLGTNELWFSKLDTTAQKFVRSEQVKLSMTPGAGPRHLVFHPNNKWIYVLNELDCTITFLIQSEDGAYESGPSVSTLPKDYNEKNTCADIHTTSDGKFIYASNRGHNSIVVFEVNPLSGSLRLVGYESTRGNWPRNFSLSPDDNYLLVANQRSDNIVSFKRDNTTGLLAYIDQVEALSPVCILF